MLHTSFTSRRASRRYLHKCVDHAFPPQLHNNNGPVATRPPSLPARPASDIQASEIAELRAENSNLRSANAEFLDMQDIIIARLSDIEQGTYYSGGSGNSGGSGSGSESAPWDGHSGRGTCGYLTPVTYWECPGYSGAVSGSGAGSGWPVNLLPCDQAAFGDLCEGDGECDTENNLDNCHCANPGNTAHRGCDVYRKSATPPTPAPTNRPTLPPTPSTGAWTGTVSNSVCSYPYTFAGTTTLAQCQRTCLENSNCDLIFVHNVYGDCFHVAGSCSSREYHSGYTIYFLTRNSGSGSGSAGGSGNIMGCGGSSGDTGIGACGRLTPISRSECPSDPDLPDCLTVPYGQLCEGDDECDTNGLLDNCNNGYDVYRKSCH